MRQRGPARAEGKVNMLTALRIQAWTVRVKALLAKTWRPLVQIVVGLTGGAVVLFATAWLTHDTYFQETHAVTLWRAEALTGSLIMATAGLGIAVGLAYILRYAGRRIARHLTLAILAWVIGVLAWVTVSERMEALKSYPPMTQEMSQIFDIVQAWQRGRYVAAGCVEEAIRQHKCGMPRDEFTVHNATMALMEALREAGGTPLRR